MPFVRASNWLSVEHEGPCTLARHGQKPVEPILYNMASRRMDALIYIKCGSMPNHCHHELVPADYTVTTCRRMIAEQLPVRYPAIDHMAQLLGISVRTLQRRLQAKGVIYQELVDEVRLDLACRLLEKPNTTVADAARATGYADPSSFSRAFRRWKHVSPLQYRHRLRSKAQVQG